MDDEQEQEPDNHDKEIVKAVGEELQRARAGRGWTRKQLSENMNDTPENTIATREQGVRAFAIPVLVTTCQAMNVSAVEVLALAFQRLQLDSEDAIRLDLRKIMHDYRADVRLLHVWAQNRLKRDGFDTNSSEPAVVVVPWAVMKELGIMCGFTPKALRSYIKDFTPDRAQLIN